MARQSEKQKEHAMAHRELSVTCAIPPPALSIVLLFHGQNASKCKQQEWNSNQLKKKCEFIDLRLV